MGSKPGRAVREDGSMPLPPGPREPSALQTYEWVARPTTLMRRAQARYGEPFTLRLAWSDAPMVFTSDPAEIKRVYTADPAVLHAGASSAFLEPFAGPRSILVLDGAEHMRERKLMLPPFHGEALARWKATMASVAEEEIARWEPGRPLKTLEHMQQVALEVILRVVFGGGDPALRTAIRRALQVPMPMLLAMSLWQGERGPYAAYLRRVRRLDALLYERIDATDGDGSLLAVLKAAEPEREQLRDQLATLLAAGHETTAGSLGWALERLARHPEVLARVREGDEAYLDAVVKEVLRVRPVLAITPRKVEQPYELGGWTLPPGVHVTPCIYLAHRRPDVWDRPTEFRPERFLEGSPPPYSYIPFGGGIRRCVGAAFATLEMKEVLRALAARFALRPALAGGERVRRRSITMTPARGGYVVPHSPRADVLPSQPPDRELPDLQSRAAG
jgi:cytochrome P450 family 135